MFHRLGAFVSRFWLPVILAWAAALVGLELVAPRWGDVTLDGNEEYLPADMTSVQGARLLAEAFPNIRGKSQIVVVIERPDGRLSKQDNAAIKQLALALREEFADLLPAVGQASVGPVAKKPMIAAIWSPVALSNSPAQAALAAELRSQVSENGQAALILLHLRSEFMATGNMKILARVLKVLDHFRSLDSFPADRLRLGVAGSAAIGSDMLTAAAESIKRTEMVTIILVLAILLVVYRAPVLALIPLATIFVSVMVATDVIALLTQYSQQVDWFTFKVFKTTRVFLIVILFGAGTDFCLFLIARYREALYAGAARPRAVGQALGRVGVALSASALTTIVGLGMMVFADFGKFRYAGPALALSLTLALLACVTLAPALLRACGGVVFWPFGVSPPGDGGGRSRGVWAGLSRGIIARPGLILITSVVLLSPAAWYGLNNVEPTYDLLNELSADRPSVQGTAMVRRHLPAGETGPVTIVAMHTSADFRSREEEQVPEQVALRDLTVYFGSLEGVIDVRSWWTPFGKPAKRLTAFEQSSRRVLAESRFVSQVERFGGRVTKFQLVLSDDPFSPAAAKTLARIRSYVEQLSQGKTPPGAKAFDRQGDSLSLSKTWTDAEFHFLGATASTADLKAVTTSDRSRIQVLCVVAVLAVLLVLLRRPLVCGYLILSVLFSYFVAIGTTQWVFGLVYGPEFSGLDWKVPLFLFVILVAIGQDYNIYLTTRVFEEQQRLGLIDGLREAIVRTGGIITSCGVIMAGTFMSMMSGSLRGMLELGFALSLGVMLDTFIVRPVLVPAFLALLYRWQMRRNPRPTPPIARPHSERRSAAEV